MATNREDWRARFTAWQEMARATDRRAEAISRRRHDKGWQIAAAVGIPRDGCCLHNASIDDEMSGWCKDNPHRLAEARRASRYVNDWRANRAAERMISAAWRALNLNGA